MTIALELRGVRKRFNAGAGGCRAFVDVLRGVDLIVRSGECVVIAGPAGCGKSTLLLCAAGLLTPESGEREWFGEPSRALAAHRVLYHRVSQDLMRRGCADEPHLHVMDGIDHTEVAAAAWIGERCEMGDAVLVATANALVARRSPARTLVMRSGQLHPFATPHARVAERVHR